MRAKTDVSYTAFVIQGCLRMHVIGDKIGEISIHDRKLRDLLLSDAFCFLNK